MNDWDGSYKQRLDAYIALLAECMLMADAKLASIKHIEQLKAFDVMVLRDVKANEDDIEIQKMILQEAASRLGGLLISLMFIKRLKVVPQEEGLFWDAKREKIQDADGFDWSSNNLS